MKNKYQDCLKKSRQFLNFLKKIDCNIEKYSYIRQVLEKKLNFNERKILFEKAKNIRNRCYGNNIYIRASIEISNICTYTSKFCGMSINNKEIRRYILDERDIFKTIDKISLLGITHVHIVSGESRSEKIEYLCAIIRYAKEKGLLITLVLGRRSINDYILLKEAGADRYILKFETSNEQLYHEIKGNTYLDERIADLLFLREIGFKIGTGIIYGLPGSSINDHIKDLELLKMIAPDMASVSVFSPNGSSEFKHEIPGDKDGALGFVALMRILLQDNPPMISCSSSFGIDEQKKVLDAGANVISYHATPNKVIDLYSAYRNENRVKTNIDKIFKLANMCNMRIKEYK